MKTLLLSGCLLVIAGTAWSQQKKDPTIVMSMQQYWDTVKKKNETQLKAPLELMKKEQNVSAKEQFSRKLIMPSYVNRNVMPVLYPDSNYVYNMPGTHAFDKSKAKGGVIFVATNPAKISVSAGEKK